MTFRWGLVGVVTCAVLTAVAGCTSSSPNAGPDVPPSDTPASDVPASDGGGDARADSTADVTDASTGDASGPCTIPAGASVAAALDALRACTGGVSSTIADDRTHRDLDVLFLIDNSPSMAPKQRALASAIPRFFSAIDATGASYHLAVATSDVGTWTAPSTPWSTPLMPACDSFEGDDGTLQRVACTTRPDLTTAASAACAALCPDDRFVPAVGAGYIAKDNGATNVPVSMVGGVDVGPQRAFQCVALVGDSGCGVEGQFEGMKRALDGHNPANAGFLRPSSLLAVVMITDEDDCSVSPSGRAENNPATMSCATPDANAAAGCFNLDYRCIARDVVCDEPLNTPGLKRHCAERPTSYLSSVAGYAAFLRALRPTTRLVFGGMWSTPGLQSGGTFSVVYPAGAAMTSPGLNRSIGSDATCVSASDATIVGRPQIRLSALAAQLPGSVEASVCDSARYGDALASIARTITSRLTVACLDAAPRAGADGTPVCVVGDVPSATPDAVPSRAMPLCGASCCAAWAAAARPSASDPAVAAACRGEAATPCYCALRSGATDVCSGGALAAVWRAGGAASPDGTVTRFACAR